jgi:outer membrane protein TolC
MALTAGQMFAGGAGFWTLAGNVSQPIFQGGALLHHERAARAAMTAAEDQYQGTVLSAFQNVADTLRALQQDAVALQVAAAAQSAAQTSLELTRRQLQTGYANYPALLNAEQNFQQSVVNRVQAQASRYADTAALFLALGGGWWNERKLPPSQGALAGQ